MSLVAASSIFASARGASGGVGPHPAITIARSSAADSAASVRRPMARLPVM
jgi:hypothetical protein